MRWDSVTRRVAIAIIGGLAMGGCDAAQAFGPPYSPAVLVSTEIRALATNPMAPRRLWVTITNTGDASVHFLHEMALEREQWGGWLPVLDGVLVVDDAAVVRIGAGESVSYATPWTTADLEAERRYRLVARLHAGERRGSPWAWVASSTLESR